MYALYSMPNSIHHISYVLLWFLSNSFTFLQIVSIIYVCLLLFESFPWYMVLMGLVTNAVYYTLLNDFPYISFTSPIFLFSVGEYSYLHF